MMSKFYILIAIAISSVLHSQNIETDFYEVNMFKRINLDDAERTVFLKIDSTGNIFKNNIPSGKRVNIKSFNTSIHRLVNLDRKIEKIPGSDEPPRISRKPNLNKQNFYLNVVFLKDFHKEKMLGTNTKYSWKAEDISNSENVYSWFDYLSKKDLKLITEMLE